MIFDFLVLFLTFKLMLELNIKNKNFYLKNHKNNFNKKHYFDDILRIAYFEIMLNQKSITYL
jgi:hypothetical protein